MKSRIPLAVVIAPTLLAAGCGGDDAAELPGPGRAMGSLAWWLR